MSRVIPAHVVLHRRLDVPFEGDEKTMLSALLDRYRETMLWKLEGLSTEEASRRLVPSATTLLGVVKHLAYVEMGWFREEFAGENITYPWPESENDNDPDFRLDRDDTIESVSALYREQIARSRAIVASASLDDASKKKERPRSLRYIMMHMLEETARHAGHADILRELTDGAIGQ
jgi:uncharacterized damage-inducible protein DinB